MDQSDKSECANGNRGESSESNKVDSLNLRMDLEEEDDDEGMKQKGMSAAAAAADNQFQLQEDGGDSPRAPIFVAGRSPRYVKQSPRKGDPGTLVYEAQASHPTQHSSASPLKMSPRVQLLANDSTVSAPHNLNQPTPVVMAAGSPGGAVNPMLMSPLRFGQSPLSTSPSGGTGGGMSLEELMKSAETAANYKLMHDIATDNTFKLSPRQPLPDSLEGRIKAMMEKAFWDLLKEDLESEEPVYEQVLSLLQDIKETVLDSLLQTDNCASIAAEFRERLDLDLIRQQLQSDPASFQLTHYSTLILDTLARVCAPCRDARIAQLRNTTDTVVMLRELMKTLDLMKLDMANYLIEQSRPLLQMHSVETERRHFDALLQAHKKDKVDALHRTKEWLCRARQRLIEDPSLSDKPQSAVTSSSGSGGPTGREILHEAFMELLDWRHPIENIPETCVVDVVRVKELAWEYKTVVLSGCVLLITLNTVGLGTVVSPPTPSDSPDSSSLSTSSSSLQAQSLVDRIKSKIKDILSQSPCVSSPEEEALDGIVDQTVKCAYPSASSASTATVSSGSSAAAEKEEKLRSQLMQLTDSNHPVKKLLQRRVQRYLKTCLDSATHSNPASVPAALVPVQKELTLFTSHFLKVTSYNREVYRPHYTQIVDNMTTTLD
ncbi:T-complex protein 11-like protein 2 isoform X2 [Symsagittifera roscoffensis]|uniref:T-complex protein 11-like protein 2 isoform X2 n=1 Tax=Symsagittifera roscoffensis TaxID=84072 RepID=UPI00307C22CD